MPRCFFQYRWRWTLGVLGLLAQALVVTAVLWHHHDDHGESPGRCGVCVAVMLNDLGAPPLPVFILPGAPLAGFVPVQPFPVFTPPEVRAPHARGPPSDLA